MGIYSVIFYLIELEVNSFVSTILYFGYMFVLSLTFFIICGTVGFLSSDIFVRKIYSATRID